MARPLKEQTEEWRRGDGAPIQLCVVEELNAEGGRVAP